MSAMGSCQNCLLLSGQKAIVICTSHNELGSTGELLFFCCCCFCFFTSVLQGLGLLEKIDILQGLKNRKHLRGSQPVERGVLTMDVA